MHTTRMVVVPKFGSRIFHFSLGEAGSQDIYGICKGTQDPRPANSCKTPRHAVFLMKTTCILPGELAQNRDSEKLDLAL